MISLPYILYFFFILFIQVLFGKYFGKKELTYSEKNNKILAIAILISSYLAFYGLRGYIYTDCFQYVYCFENIDLYVDNITDSDYRQYEVGYIILNYIISFLTDDFFVFQFIWTVIDVILIHFIFKRECDKYYILAFALLLPFWNGVQMNLFRNEKVILMFFLLIPYIRQGKFWRFSGMMILASLLHSTSLFFIPVYFLIRMQSKNLWIIFCLISLVLYFIGMSDFFKPINQIAILISARYEEKAFVYTTNVVASGFTFGFLFRLLLMGIYLYYYNIMIKKNAIMTRLALLYLCTSMAFSSVLVFRDRFMVLFVLGLICTLPLLLVTMNIQNKVKKVWLVNERNIKRYRFKSAKYMLACLLVLFVKLGSIAYLYVQTNNIGAMYENVITGVSNIYKAQMRAEKSAEEYERR